MESVKNLVIATLVTVAVGITFAGCGTKKDEVKTEGTTPVATEEVKTEAVPVETEVKTEEAKAEETPAETEVKTEETKTEETNTEEVKAE